MPPPDAPPPANVKPPPPPPGDENSKRTVDQRSPNAEQGFGTPIKQGKVDSDGNDNGSFELSASERKKIAKKKKQEEKKQAKIQAQNQNQKKMDEFDRMFLFYFDTDYFSYCKL